MKTWGFPLLNGKAVEMEVSHICTVVFLSLKTGLAAIALNTPLALLVANYLERKRKKESPFIEGLINLPLVMPPVTTGYLLLILLGRKGLIGSFVYRVTGRSLAYSWAAVLIASMIVSFPLIIRSIRTAMAMVDRRLELAARTLGASGFSLFSRVILPLILPGVVNGLLLGFARSLGEFGATVTFAGNIEGVTRTIPLAVYSFLQVPGREREAAVLVLISIIISFGSLYLSSHLSRRIRHESQF